MNRIDQPRSKHRSSDMVRVPGCKLEEFPLARHLGITKEHEGSH
jgi:hypothetical protein